MSEKFEEIANCTTSYELMNRAKEYMQDSEVIKEILDKLERIFHQAVVHKDVPELYCLNIYISEFFGYIETEGTFDISLNEKPKCLFAKLDEIRNLSNGFCKEWKVEFEFDHVNNYQWNLLHHIYISGSLSIEEPLEKISTATETTSRGFVEYQISCLERSGLVRTEYFKHVKLIYPTSETMRIIEEKEKE